MAQKQPKPPEYIFNIVLQINCSSFYFMKIIMIFLVDVLSSHMEVTKWRHFKEIWCFLNFTNENVCCWENHTAKSSNLWYCTKNHTLMAKTCSFGPKKVIFDPSNHPDPFKTLFWHFLFVHRDQEMKRGKLQRNSEKFIFGGFGHFWITLNQSA